MIGARVHQGTTCPDFIVQMEISSTILRMRGVANQTVHLIPIKHVTMKTFRLHLTGIKWRWCHVTDLVIISLVFISLIVIICIALKNLNAVNSKLQVRTIPNS